jgi:maltose-binding protein MalE
MKSRRISVLFAVAFAAVLAAVAGGIKAAAAAGPVVTIWTDQDRKTAVTQVANEWAQARGATVNIVIKNFGDIRDNLGTVSAADAPDVIVGAHDWTGQLAANGLVVPLRPSSATLKQFPKYTLDAFSYGTGVKNLYGAPVAVENIALVVNTSLVKVPKTWAQLETEALAYKKKVKGPVGIAVQQGSGGDAYHMYPFFSGLGGYVFGTTKAGTLNPTDIGVANKTFLKNSTLIDRWNKEGLINAKVDASTAQNVFLKKQAAFWVTGPWNIDTLNKSGIKYTVVQVPPIAKPAVPFLGVQGFMVTKYAATHNVASLAQDLVGNYMMSPAAQALLASGNNRYPANTAAGKLVKDPVLALFGKASTGGVPMPNIPQMSNVWSDLGAAWVRSTKGAGSMKASRSFTGAAKAIALKIKAAS